MEGDRMEDFSSARRKSMIFFGAFLTVFCGLIIGLSFEENAKIQLSESLTLASLIIVGTLVITRVGHWHWSRVISKWAIENQVELLDFRGSSFSESKKAFLASTDMHVMRIKVRDQSGRIRLGWLTYDFRFWPFHSRRGVVYWDSN